MAAHSVSCDLVMLLAGVPALADMVFLGCFGSAAVGGAGEDDFFSR